MAQQNSNNTVRKIVTKEILRTALQELGVRPGMIMEVHSSLASFGYVVGGARTVVDALMEAVGENGTLLMATQTADNTDPSVWCEPPVMPALWADIRESMPAYDPETEDMRGMGAIAENFRHRAETVCSSHPAFSYTAWGRYAKLLCNRQSMHFPLGEESPSARLYELKGMVLLLGVDFSSCTCMHLAEYRTECRPILIEESCTMINRQRVWKRYLNLDLNSDTFNKIRPLINEYGTIRETMIGACHAQFFSATAAIDAATRFFEENSIYSRYR